MTCLKYLKIYKLFGPLQTRWGVVSKADFGTGSLKESYNTEKYIMYGSPKNISDFDNGKNTGKQNHCEANARLKGIKVQVFKFVVNWGEV